MVFVKLPVPPQLRAESGLPLPHPFLEPEGGDGGVEDFELVGDLEHLIRTSLHADDRAAKDPIWQGTHPAGVLGVLPNELGRGLSTQDLAAHPRGEDLDLDSVLLLQVERRVLVVLQKERAHLGRNVVRHAGVAGVRVSTSISLPVRRPRYGLFAPPYPLLLDEDRDLAAFEVEVRILHPEAEEALLRRGSVGQIDAVVGLLYLSHEAQPSFGHGRERERVVQVSSIADEAPGDDERGSHLLDAVYGLVHAQLLYLVFDEEVPARLAYRLLAPGGRDEALPRDGAPQETIWIGAGRDAQESITILPGLELDDELAHLVKSGRDLLRHVRERAGDLTGFAPDDEGYKGSSGGHQDQYNSQPHGFAGLAESLRQPHRKPAR